MKWKKEKQKMDVRAYANMLQQHLDITVTPVDFYYAGWFGPVDKAPCSLITVEPYCPGGTRRLVLNSRHPLILALAKTAVSSNVAKQQRLGILAMGEAMIWTGSRPIKGLDILRPSGPIYWENAKGLICGPHFDMVTPVRHEEVHIADSDVTALAIWPKRPYSVLLRKEKSDPSIVTKLTCTFGEKWEIRDQVLMDEWRSMRMQKKSILFPNPDLQGIDFVTLSPFLPILALAHKICLSKARNDLNENGESSTRKVLHTDRSNALGKATAMLLSCDRLFCLSLFFNVPLIDRTRTLRGAIRIKHIVKSPPSFEEVEIYQQTAPADAHEALEKAMLQRAKAVWVQAKNENASVIVCWSGGIDSTALLVCLFRTQNDEMATIQLSVICDEESIAENPSFYETHLKNSSVSIITRDDRTVSDFATKFPGALIVTGELGDQLFGSDKCMIAFPDPIPTDLSQAEEDILIALNRVRRDGDVQVSLDQPWKESLLPLLSAQGLQAGVACDWQTWISPQLEKAPFPIISLYDMLWWLNFSCKWQNVSLRCLHDGGDYNPAYRTGSIVHFYDDRQLECWACVEKFHKTKFADLRDWKTYKEPLKKLIFSYDNNEEYYREKEKVGSLNFDLEEKQKKSVESCVGLVIDAKGKITQFSWGAGSVTDFRVDNSEHGLEHFLDPWIFEQMHVRPSLCEEVITVNPWDGKFNETAAFSVAPWFAQEDERQRRIRNPITSTTLVGKCSALLPPDLVRGKTILDLGACLGSMCHWSLFHGAKKAVAVEPQKDFCDRMEHFLAKAEDTWPKSHSSSSRYEVVCADARKYLSQCKDQEFDIVVAAGVLHCFQDPVSILLEIGRICKDTIAIESVHPTYYRKGLNPEPNTFAGPILELNPSAAVNKAGADASFTGLTVIPSKDLMKNLFTAVGFSISTINLSPHPTTNEDVMVYTGSRVFDSSPVRFFLQCRRTLAETAKLTSLEEVIDKGEGQAYTWDDAHGHQWTTFRPDQQGNKTYSGRISSRKENTLSKSLKWIGTVTNHFQSVTSNRNHEACAYSPGEMDDQQDMISEDKASVCAPHAFRVWNSIETMAHTVNFDGSRDKYPYEVVSWGHLSAKKGLALEDAEFTHYGYIFSGETTLTRSLSLNNPKLLTSSIVQGMFFSCPGKCTIQGGSGFVVSVPKGRDKYRNYGIFMMAGPLEADTDGNLTGTLPYIDGCSDTVLIHPQIYGEPCLNHLHFPSRIKQTQHTHPSGRAGMVIQGEGNCVVIDPETKLITKTPLTPGTVFVIPTDSPHAFETQNSTLDVIAFHPDSDYGPTKTDHPMVNRTIVNGVSASLIPSIQTDFSPTRIIDNF